MKTSGIIIGTVLCLVGLIWVTVRVGQAAGLPHPEPGWERMVQQRRVDPFTADALDPHRPAMRMPPPGTIDRHRPIGDGPMNTGMARGQYVEHAPFPIDAAMLRRGEDRFAIFCAVCHGITGDGNSPVARRMSLVPPRNLLMDTIRAYPIGHIYQVITDGDGLMPPFRDGLRLKDRWRVAAYVKTLQFASHVPVDTLPPAARRMLQAEPP